MGSVIKHHPSRFVVSDDEELNAKALLLDAVIFNDRQFKVEANWDWEWRGTIRSNMWHLSASKALDNLIKWLDGPRDVDGTIAAFRNKKWVAR